MKSGYLSCSWGKVHIVRIDNSYKQTLVCLHGWMDNWASFKPISQYLKCNLVMVDLPGHGFSEHIQDGNWYHFIDYPVRLHEILQQLELESVFLMAHSLGAAIAAVYAGAFPEKVEAIILIDGLGPLVNKPEQAAEILRESILNRSRKIKKRIYKDKQMAVKARMSAGNISRESAELLVDNMMIKSDDGWNWAYDTKLKHVSSLRLTRQQLAAFLKEIKCPALLIPADQGFVKNAPYWEDRFLISEFKEVLLPGKHHIHMDSPEIVAKEIGQFLDQF